jgi:hypothetical protein
VLAHLDRSCCAVQTDHVGPHGVQGGEGGPYLAAHEHAPGRLDGDLELERHRPAGLRHGPPAADDGRLGLEEVLDGLDHEQVDASGEEPGRRFLVAVSHIRKGNLAQRGDLGPRSQGAGDEVAGPVTVGDVPRDRSRGPGQLSSTTGYPVLRQDPRQRAEAVGLDDLAADVEEGAVQICYHVWPGEAQHLVATLERRAAEVVLAQAQSLQVGARRPVEDDYAVVDGLHIARRVQSHPLDGT